MTTATFDDIVSVYGRLQLCYVLYWLTWSIDESNHCGSTALASRAGFSARCAVVPVARRTARWHLAWRGCVRRSVWWAIGKTEGATCHRQCCWHECWSACRRDRTPDWAVAGSSDLRELTTQDDAVIGYRSHEFVTLPTVHLWLSAVPSDDDKHHIYYHTSLLAKLKWQQRQQRNTQSRTAKQVNDASNRINKTYNGKHYH